MPGPDRFLTNLESDELIAKWVTNAGDDTHAASLAKARSDGHTSTHALLRVEHGDYTVGKPRATKWKTAATLEAEGYVGIYKTSDGL